MSIFIILKIISFCLTAGVIVLGWRALQNMRTRLLFSSMLIFFFLSTILFATEGTLDTWLKHILFYIGQFLFYLFLVAIIASHDKESEKTFSPSLKSDQGHGLLGAMTMPLAAQSGLSDWLEFITDQGMQHMLTIPLLLLIVTTVEIRYVFVTSKAFQSVLNMFMLAAATLVMIHFMEFAVESQGLIPVLEGDPIEIMEFGWFYAGLFFFAMGILKLKKLADEKKATVTF